MLLIFEVKILIDFDLNEIRHVGLEELIETSIQIKNKIVLSDPLEKGERKQLNLGHTFGHAIESYYFEKGTSILHGEAVFMGILLEIEIDIYEKY